MYSVMDGNWTCRNYKHTWGYVYHNKLNIVNDTFSPIRIKAIHFNNSIKQIDNSNEYIVPGLEFDGEKFKYIDHKLNIFYLVICT
mgnify:CR=1 FL=1